MTGRCWYRWLLLAGICSLAWGAADVVVFPLENRTGRPELEWLSYGMAFTVEDALGACSWLDRLDAMEQMDLPETTNLTLATRFTVAQRMGARFVVVGWYRRDGEHVRLHLDRFDRERGRRVTCSGTVSMERPVADTLAVVQVLGGKDPYHGAIDSHAYEKYARALLRARFSGEVGALSAYSDRYQSIPIIQERIGHLAFQLGDMELSWRCFGRLEDMSERDLLAAGLSGVKTGRTRQALPYFLQGLGKGRQPAFLINAAGCLLQEGKPSEALLLLAEAGPSEMAGFDRAVTLAVLGRWPEVIEAMTPLLGSLATHPNDRFLLQLACQHVPDAAPCALPELASKKQETTAVSVVERYRFAESLSGEEMVDLAPLKRAYFNLATQYLATGETDRSKETLCKLLTLDPLNIPARCMMCTRFHDAASCHLLERLDTDCSKDSGDFAMPVTPRASAGDSPAS